MNKVTRISQHTGVSTFASRTSPSTDQSLQKSFHLSHPDKIELKKISFPSENKKYTTTQPDTTQTETAILSKDKGLQTRKTEGLLLTTKLSLRPQDSLSRLYRETMKAMLNETSCRVACILYFSIMELSLGVFYVSCCYCNFFV